MRVIELFGGIGACSKALKRLGLPIDIVDYVEIDKYAVNSYNAINGTNFEPQDITKWDKDFTDIDLIMHGSPCQDFSLAGKQAGGDVNSGTRSSLMYETLRIVENIKPKYVVWENVKNLLSVKHRHNFDAYLKTMEDLGYKNYYQVLNSKDYGIPQNRERVFTVSILNNEQNFKFPTKKELRVKLKDILEVEVDEKYYNVCPSMVKALKDNKVKDVTHSDYCSTLTTKQARWNNAGMITNNNRLRYLSTKECWRLMGFNDEDFEKAQKVNSDTQLYKQAGNSIVVNVLEAIFKNLLYDNLKLKEMIERFGI